MKGCFGLKLTDRCSTIFVKTVVVLLGSIALGLIFMVEKLGGVLAVSVPLNNLSYSNYEMNSYSFVSVQITGSLAAIAAGTSFGVFTLGILFPWTNSKVN